MTPEDSAPVAPEKQETPATPAPQLETAEEHSGSDHVSHGANSNLTPASAQSDADAQAAREILRQRQGE